MKRPWPIIAVADGASSVAWYTALLNATENHAGARVFNGIQDEDGTVLVCLHWWGPSGPTGGHEWPPLVDPGEGRPWNGDGYYVTIYEKRPAGSG